MKQLSSKEPSEILLEMNASTMNLPMLFSTISKLECILTWNIRSLRMITVAKVVLLINWSDESITFGCNATLLMAPPGVAANNISALSVPASKSNLAELNSEMEIAFEEELNGIRFVIMDEASTFSFNLFFKVVMRLKEAKQRFPNIHFGCLCVYLVSDSSHNSLQFVIKLFITLIEML